MRWRRLIHLVLAAAIVVALFEYGIVDGASLLNTLLDERASVLVIVLLLLAFVLCAIRWMLVLRAFGAAPRLRRVMEILAIGELFNLLLPGGTGGDVVRAAYVARGMPEARTAAVVSVLADRAMSLYGMLLVAVVLIAVNATKVFAQASTAWMAWTVLALFAGLTAGGLGLLLAPRTLQRLPFAQSWEHRGGFRRVIVQVIALFDVFRRSLPAMAASIALSVLAGLISVGCVVAFALAHSASALGAAAYAGAAVLALLANAIPLTPGGIGVGEGVFAYVCHQWSQGATLAAFGTVFLSYRLVLTGVSLLGAVALATHAGSELTP